MTPRLVRALAWVAAVAVLAGVFGLYRMPELAVWLANARLC